MEDFLNSYVNKQGDSQLEFTSPLGSSREHKSYLINSGFGFFSPLSVLKGLQSKSNASKLLITLGTQSLGIL